MSQPATPEQDTTGLILAQGRANHRLRRFAYVAIGILIAGVITVVILGVINTVGLSDEQANSKQARDDNHTLLERSVAGNAKANLLFNQALQVLREVGTANVESVARFEQDMLAILRANGFTIPKGIPSH